MSERELEITEEQIKEIYHRGMFAGALIGVIIGMAFCIIIIAIFEKDPKQVECAKYCKVVPK